MHRALSLREAAVMHSPIVYSIREQPAGLWGVCCGDNVLYEAEQIGAAIKLAREAARDEYQRTGQSVTVELPCVLHTISLAHYARSGTGLP
jgi:hypothetical protein